MLPGADAALRSPSVVQSSRTAGPNMASLLEFMGHLAACGLFAAAVSKWVEQAFFVEPTHFPGVIIRVLWVAIMCCIVSPLPSFTAAAIAITVTIVIVLPLLSEVIADEWHAFKNRSDSTPILPIAKLGAWEYVAQLKSSNNGNGYEQFYPVTVVDVSAMDDPFWPHASLVYMVEIRRRCQVWRTITIWQVSVLNGGQKKIHTFHDFCQWTDAYWFKRRVELLDGFVDCFQTNGMVIAVVVYCGEMKVYIHDMRYGKSSVVKIRDLDLRWPISICCLGRLVNDGAVEGWRMRWVAGYPVSSMIVRRATITQKTLDVRGHMICRSHEELVFGNFEITLLFRTRTSRGHFGLVAIDFFWQLSTVMVLYDPITGKYDQCMNERDLRRSDRPYNAVRINLFGRKPMVLTDRECIATISQGGSVLRRQFAAPTLKYRTAQMLFRANPGLRNQMNAEQFRQMSGIDGMGGHFP